MAATALLATLFAATTLTAAQPNKLTPDQIAEGWINLFDGETLFGWQPTSDANWKVQDGAITVSAGKEGFLMSSAEFADYELHVEFQSPANTNSGVFLHTPLKPTDPARDCYELNIAPQANPFPTGSLVQRKKWATGLLAANLASLPQMIGSAAKPEKGPKLGDGKRIVSQGPPEVSANEPSESSRSQSPVATVARDSDGWHAFDVRMAFGDVDVCLNRQRLYTLKDQTALRRGHIGLQFREGPVSFRSIRLRPVGLKSMLNGKDLAGWNTEKVEVAKYEMTPEGELHVTNGRGQLESNNVYGDFLMQLQCRVDGDGLNSGVFFRAIPHEFWNGYECQINNAVKDNDPNKPADFGTGAIYRRIAARRVVSKDHEWFNMTLSATGPHMAAWVNGYQVTDWTDERKPHENPRNGLRTNPGSIILQAHDPTTNFRFKALRIAELPTSLNHDDTTQKKN